jgi:hypothetical protein
MKTKADLSLYLYSTNKTFPFLALYFLSLKILEAYKMPWGASAWEERSLDIRPAFWLGIGTYNL